MKLSESKLEEAFIQISIIRHERCRPNDKLTKKDEDIYRQNCRMQYRWIRGKEKVRCLSQFDCIKSS